MGIVLEKGLVSVIIATRDRFETLVLAVESVLTQRYSRCEVIVVNDGAEDPSAVLQQKFPDSVSIRVVNLPERRGAGAARNAGLEIASGEFLSYLDDDDTFLPNHFEVLVSEMESRKIDVAYSDCEKFTYNDQGMLIEQIEVSNPEFDFERLLRENYVPLNTFVHRRACLDRFGNFDEHLTALEDWDLWVRFAKECRFEHVPATTCRVFIRALLPGMGANHPFGYSWPALNFLYKGRLNYPERQDLHALYVQRASAALDHLAQTMFHLWQARAENLVPIFSFHTPDRVYHRLLELQPKYPGLEAGFLQLRGMLKAQMGEYIGALPELEQALGMKPESVELTRLIEVLKQAVG